MQIFPSGTPLTVAFSAGMSYNPYMGALESYLASSGIGRYDLFCRYLDLLFEWNGRFNLTAITDRAEAEVKHIVDSLLGAEFLHGDTVLDVGAGAGFPSLPLAVARPNIRFTLVDSLGKRVRFLETVIAELGLSNATAVHARAEDLPKGTRYGTVTARAVAPLNVLAEYCLPFVETGGIMLAYKGPSAKEEVDAAKNAVRILGGDTPEIFTKTLCATGREPIGRTFVVIKKTRPTPAAYPRGGNKPRLKPL